MKICPRSIVVFALSGAAISLACAVLLLSSPAAADRAEAAPQRPLADTEIADPTKKKGTRPRRCDAGTICVGVGQAYPTLSEAAAVARPGDVIEVIGGVYREAAVIGVPNVTVRGVRGRPHFDCTGLPLPEDKACILLTADAITLQNLEISGAVLPDQRGANGACIRNQRDLNFTLRRISCHGSQDGLLTNGGQVVIEGSEFYDNGWTDQTHNVYFSGNCISVTVRNSIFRDARVGHEFKSRCPKTDISDSVFRSTSGSRDLDIPDGGETTVYRSTLIMMAGSQSEDIVGFTPESCAHPGDLILKDVTIVNSRPDADIRNFDKCKGKAIILERIRSMGMPFKKIGYVVER